MRQRSSSVLLSLVRIVLVGVTKVASPIYSSAAKIESLGVVKKC